MVDTLVLETSAPKACRFDSYTRYKWPYGERVDTLDLKSGIARCVGANPTKATECQIGGTVDTADSKSVA